MQNTDQSAGKPAAWRVLLGPVLLIAVVMAVYLPSMRNGFVYDDRALIIEQAAPESLSDVGRVFAERHWKGLPYYRPIPRATMVLQKYLYGDGPAPYHLFNALVMGLAALAALALLRSPVFGLNRFTAWLGAALFALHPIASTTVYPIASGRETLIPAVFAVAAVWAWLRPGRVGSILAVVLFALALLSKEQAIVIPVVFALADLLGLSPNPPGRDIGAWVRRYVPLAVIVAGYIAVRLALFGGMGEHTLEVLRVPNGPLLSLLFTLQSIFDPAVGLSYEPRVEAWFAIGHLFVVIIVVAGLGAWAARQWSRVRAPFLFWLGWVLLALAPTANLLHQETRFAERYGFLALLGVIGIVLSLVSTMQQGSVGRRILPAAGILLVAASALVSYERGNFYADEEAFLRQWLTADPGSPKAHHAMGQHYYGQERYEEAALHFEEALRQAPNYAAAHNNLGTMLAMRGELDRAIEHFRQAIEINPDYAYAYNNLASLLVTAGDGANAIAAYEKSRELDGSDAVVHYALGDLYIKTGRPTEGRESLETAVRIDPNHAEAHYALGNFYLSQRDEMRAEFHFERAALIDPDNVRAHNNLGTVLGRRKEFARAAVHFEQAIRADPTYAQAHVNYGNLLLLQRQTDEALEHLEEALRLAPESKAAQDSLARAHALIEQQRQQPE